ncbi:hypothetical protein SAMN06265360_10620 [Haloechinothrix alba]|uniref:Phage tail tube protein n=1 Tax=Haloechinothrix alba TaxID=664784 RepID=A0A238WCS0_9PSEU|nr:hypothetical protein [Haloechinothrix alba]SNR44084.1 hypothetical protein SAMN06265360_10620 [Haloechinothrix alba]
MAGTKINARDIHVEVQDSDGTWLEVDGLNSVTVNPSENEQTADTTVFESEGHYEQEVMQRGSSMSLEGFKLKDATGAPDPGQGRLEELATMMAAQSLGAVRFRHPDDSEWTVWDATVSIGSQGGNNNAKTSWSCTLTRSGKSTTSTVA